MEGEGESIANETVLKKVAEMTLSAPGRMLEGMLEKTGQLKKEVARAWY